MNIKLIKGINLLESIKSTIKVLPKNEECFIVVPDRATLQIEELLFDTLQIKATFNLNIVGLTNLALKYIGVEYKPISEIESILYVKKSIENLKGRLKYFKSTNINFCKEIYKIISQLKSSNIFSNEIVCKSENAFLQNKMEDLKKIYEEYEILTAEMFDSSDLLDKFIESVNNNQNFKNINFVFVGFDSFTSKHFALIEALYDRCKSILISIVDSASFKNSYIYEHDIENKINFLAKKHNAIVDVVFPNSVLNFEVKHISENLFANSIDVAQSDKVTILEAKTKKCEVETVAKLIAFEIFNGARYNDFAVCVSDLENYKNDIQFIFEKNGIPFYLDSSINASQTYLALLFLKILKFPYKNYSKNDLLFILNSPIFKANANLIAKINESYIGGAKDFFALKDIGTFKKLVEQISLDFLNGAKKVIDCIEEGLQYLTELNLDEKVLSIEKQVPDILREIISASEETFCVEDLKEFISSLEIGLASKEISTIPSYYDQVYVGDSTESFFGEVKKLFVLGANAGLFPNIKDDSSIFSDDDFLRSGFSKKVEPTIKMINRRVRFKIFSLLTQWTEHLYISYSLMDDESKPISRSMVLEQIIAMFDKKNKIISHLLVEEKSIDNFVLAMGRSKIGAEEFLVNLKEGEFKNSLQEVLSFNLKKFERKNVLNCSSKIGLGQIIKPTEIEKFYDCPFKVYCDNVLKLSIKKTGNITSAEIGSIVHAILENYGKVYSYKDLPEQQFDLFIDEQLDSFLKNLVLEDPDVTKIKLKTDIKRICKKITREIESSQYTPWLFEEKIDGEINGKKFLGRVDRVDRSDEYFRIIDYKTGKITSNLIRDLNYGKKLQLFSYSKMISQKSGLKCGGIYYFNAKLKYTPATEKDLVGLTILDDQEKLDDNKKITSDEFINNLQIKAEKLLSMASDYLSQGFIMPYPDAKSCEFCPYKSICLYDKEKGVRLFSGGDNE